jgi:hypothetical protein
MINNVMEVVRMFAVSMVLVMSAACLILLSACSGDVDDPEQQIREMIHAGEAAFEARSIVEVLDYIADSYQDQEGRQKRDIQRLVAGYILRNKSIHLLTRIHHIALNQDGNGADVTLYVGMAGVPVGNVDQLVFTRADLYRFDLSVVLEEGVWRVANGSWQQARMEDF